MAVSTVDGTIQAFDLKRKTPSHSVFRDLVIRGADGKEAKLPKSVVARKVADSIRIGASGRFYLYEAIDHKGIHGVRLADGTSAHGYPVMNERVMLLVLVLNCVLFVGRIAIEGRIWPLPLVLIVLASIVYPLYRRTHLEARAQFDGDKSFRAG